MTGAPCAGTKAPSSRAGAIFLGLTHHALRFPLFDERETGVLVYAILMRHLKWPPEGDVRPRMGPPSD